MATRLLYLVLLLLSCLQSSVHADARVIANRTLEAGDVLTLVSSGFPECCLQDFAYYIECTTEACGFNILFVDVDLPEQTTIEVYDGWTSAWSLLAASTQTAHGVWTRPSLVHVGSTLSLILTLPEHTLHQNHTGVKVQLEAVNIDTTPVTAAVTSLAACGSINLLQTWQGGEIHLTPNTDSGRLITTQDCIWVLKTPPDIEGLYAFVRFTYTDNLHAILEVRRGTSSVAPEVFYMDAGDRPAVIMQGRDGFSSEHGLYVRIRKQFQAGELKFVYGLYASGMQGANSSGLCSFGVHAGFPCVGQGWCLPAAARCDGVAQCRAGQDEATCTDITPTPKTVTKTAPTKQEPTREVCWAWEKNCLDGSCVVVSRRCPGECWTWEHRCQDGKCLLNGMQCPGECRTWERKCAGSICILGERCPGECLQFEKKCPDGLCIDKFKYCPSEPCPADLMHRCADQCYGEEERCNHVEFCKDGSDENFCSMPSLWGTSFTWVAIPMLGAIFIVTICVLYALRKRSSSGEGGHHLPPITGSHGEAGLGEFTGESDSVTVDVTDSPTAPLTSLPEAQAPPPYTEVVGASYCSPDSQPLTDSHGALPPPYEQVAADNQLPPKTNV